MATASKKKQTVPTGKSAKNEPFDFFEIGQAISRFNIVSGRKVRRVANPIRRKDYETALALIKVMPQKGAKILEKTLTSAFANLVNQNNKVRENMVRILEIDITDGPILKRVQPRARGRADRISKRTCHVKVVVGQL